MLPVNRPLFCIYAAVTPRAYYHIALLRADNANF